MLYSVELHVHVYDMLHFAKDYRKAIDTITADKALKLRKYELDNEEWDIIGDLVAMLEVCAALPQAILLIDTFSCSNTKRPRFSFPVILPVLLL